MGEVRAKYLTSVLFLLKALESALFLSFWRWTVGTGSGYKSWIFLRLYKVAIVFYNIYNLPISKFSSSLGQWFQTSTTYKLPGELCFLIWSHP